MQNPRLASRYAKSLLDLAVEQNSVDNTLADVQLLDNTIRQSRDFRNVLRSPIIKSDKKHEIIQAVFGKHLSQLTQAFVSLLVNKGREANLAEIANSFITQYNEMKNIKTVKLTTAAPITDNVKEAIRSKVEATLHNSGVKLIEEINPDLIGGFVLEMDDKLFDASILNDLNEVRAQFRKNIYISDIR